MFVGFILSWKLIKKLYACIYIYFKNICYMQRIVKSALKIQLFSELRIMGGE